jgi:Tol biopolymer transport system component
MLSGEDNAMWSGKLKSTRLTSMMIVVMVSGLVATTACSGPTSTPAPGPDGAPPVPAVPAKDRVVPHEEQWGIYSLELATEEVELLYSSDSAISYLTLNHAGDRLAFSQKLDGNANEDEGICTIDAAGGNFTRVTDNKFWDLYPAWSPDDSRFAFLSFRDNDLDLYMMDSDGSNARRLYDSGSHDADVHWSGDTIVFTAHSRIWSIRDDGTDPRAVTDPPDAGEWGNANLPFGDYDPRLSPDGSRIVFERLHDDVSPHGNYDIYVIGSDGSGEAALTTTGYSQGFASWSHSGDRLVFIVAAIGDEGKYHIHMMNSDGTNSRDITPEYFPGSFLCHTPVFAADDAHVFFVGQWWE